MLSGMSRYISMAAAAEQLGLSTRSIRRYVSEGLLPAYRVGPRGDIRVRPEDLDRLVRRVPTAAHRPASHLDE